MSKSNSHAQASSKRYLYKGMVSATHIKGPGTPLPEVDVAVGIPIGKVWGNKSGLRVWGQGTVSTLENT